MLIIAGTLQVDPSRREEFLRGREASVQASRAEPGCLAYVMSADPTDPGLVLLFERWESKEALGAHLAAMEAPPEDNPVLGMDIQQYEVSDAGPIGS